MSRFSGTTREKSRLMAHRLAMDKVHAITSLHSEDLSERRIAQTLNVSRKAVLLEGDFSLEFQVLCGHRRRRRSGRTERRHCPPSQPRLSIGRRDPAMPQADRMALGEVHRVPPGHDGSPRKIVSNSRELVGEVIQDIADNHPVERVTCRHCCRHSRLSLRPSPPSLRKTLNAASHAMVYPISCVLSRIEPPKPPGGRLFYRTNGTVP